jgi:hypothetical protein
MLSFNNLGSSGLWVLWTPVNEWRLSWLKAGNCFVGFPHLTKVFATCHQLHKPFWMVIDPLKFQRTKKNIAYRPLGGAYIVIDWWDKTKVSKWCLPFWLGSRWWLFSRLRIPYKDIWLAASNAYIHVTILDVYPGKSWISRKLLQETYSELYCAIVNCQQESRWMVPFPPNCSWEMISRLPTPN